MSLVTFPGGLYLPRRLTHDDNSPYVYASLLLNAAGHKAAFIVEAPKAGNIRKVGFLTGTVTTGATMDVRIETVSATDGNPTGTLWGTNTNVSHVINAADDDAWLLTAALTADAAVAKGDLLAVVIVNPAVSPGNLNIKYLSNPGGNANAIPYLTRFTSSWQAQTGSCPVIALEYSDGTYEVIQDCYPFSTIPAVLFNVNTVAQDEVALKWQLPFAGRLIGAWVWMDCNGDFELVLYSGTTAERTFAHDKDKSRGAGFAGAWTLLFANPYSFAANTVYRMALKPTTTGNINMPTGVVSSAGLMDSLEFGADFCYSSRVDAGAWSDTSTRRPSIGLLVDQIDAVVGTPVSNQFGLNHEAGALLETQRTLNHEALRLPSGLQYVLNHEGRETPDVPWRRQKRNTIYRVPQQRPGN